MRVLAQSKNSREIHVYSMAEEKTKTFGVELWLPRLTVRPSVCFVRGFFCLCDCHLTNLINSSRTLFCWICYFRIACLTKCWEPSSKIQSSRVILSLSLSNYFHHTMFSIWRRREGLKETSNVFEIPLRKEKFFRDVHFSVRIRTGDFFRICNKKISNFSRGKYYSCRTSFRF